MRLAREVGLAIVILAMTFPGARCAAEALRPSPAAAGKIAWFYLTLKGLPGETTDESLLIMTQADKAVRGVVPRLGMLALDVSELKLNGDKLSGTIVIGHNRTRQNATIPTLAQRMPLALSVSIEGESISGTYTGQWPRERDGKPMQVQGTIQGHAMDQTALEKSYALPASAHWPSYVGPHQNFSSGPSSRPIVEDFSQARLLWVSQYIGPCESGSHRYGACVGAMPSAGGASPVVADGKVFQFRYQASGEAYDAHLDRQMAGERAEENRQKMAATGWTMDDMRRRWAISADEQLICLDAVTGQTLWTVTWPDEGMNLLDHKGSLTNHTGVYAQGRMYVLGALGRLRCVDGATGEVLWSTDVPGLSDQMQEIKRKALETRNIKAPGRSFGYGLNISGSTILSADSAGGRGLVGVDAMTGEVRWRVQNVLGSGATPLAWHKSGKDYVIAANGEGKITLIEAADGRIAWQYTEAGYNDWTPLLVGDLLIANKLRGEEREKLLPAKDDRRLEQGVFSAPGSNYGQVACWRLSPEQAEQVWAAPVEWGAPADGPVGTAIDGLACFRGKYAYYIVKPDSGELAAKSFLTSPARFDEGHLLALPGMFVVHPDTQHGQTKFFPYPAQAEAEIGPKWEPPHPHATTYAVAMSHAWADGRLFIRGVDAIYCYDLRQSVHDR